MWVKLCQWCQFYSSQNSRITGPHANPQAPMLTHHPMLEYELTSKVEKILKGSLDSIPSPSLLVKIQIMGGKVCLRCKGKTLLGAMFCLYISCNNLNFHWRCWDRIQAIFFKNIFSFTKEIRVLFQKSFCLIVEDNQSNA